MRAEFLQLFCNIDHQVGFSPELPYFDFWAVFCQVMEINQVPFCDAHLYDTVFCNQDPFDKNCIVSFIFLPGFHVVHRHLFMSFLFFIVNTSVYTARMVFQYHRRLQEILFHKTFDVTDFDTVLGWDQQVGADIFRDERGSFILQLCNRVFISPLQVAKMQKIIYRYGPDLLLWVPAGGFYRKSCVNSFLFSGLMFRKQWVGKPIEAEVELAMDFLIQTCPEALRISTTDSVGKRINGFTEVLYMCVSRDGEQDTKLVHKVFSHLTLHDLHQVSYTHDNRTLANLVASSRNNLVADFLKLHLDAEIMFPPLLEFVTMIDRRTLGAHT